MRTAQSPWSAPKLGLCSVEAPARRLHPPRAEGLDQVRTPILRVLRRPSQYQSRYHQICAHTLTVQWSGAERGPGTSRIPPQLRTSIPTRVRAIASAGIHYDSCVCSRV